MGLYGVRMKMKGIQTCMIKVQSWSFRVRYENYPLLYRIAKALMGSCGVRLNTMAIMHASVRYTQLVIWGWIY